VITVFNITCETQQQKRVSNTKKQKQKKKKKKNGFQVERSGVEILTTAVATAVAVVFKGEM
jgi:hypothetical protein